VAQFVNQFADARAVGVAELGDDLLNVGEKDVGGEHA
jgi:hypothetical protein